MADMTELDSALVDLVRAIYDQGSHPVYHCQVMARHRKEWPTLWRAIDRILVAAP